MNDIALVIGLRLDADRPHLYVSVLVDDQGGLGGPGVGLYVIEMKPMESELITVDAASLANW